MGFTTAISTALRRYAVFSGRARRSEYGWFQLFTGIVLLLAGGVDAVRDSDGSRRVGSGPVGDLAALALLVPNLAVQVRRLHDIDRRGRWVLLNAVPVLGWGVLLVFHTTAGTPGGNRFGPSPEHA